MVHPSSLLQVLLVGNALVVAYFVSRLLQNSLPEQLA
jgi:hypothetical protein